MTSGSARPRVWIADDSLRDADHARGILEDAYEVQVFADGASVLEALAAGGDPDVLVVDWIMPEVSGLDVARFLKEGKEGHAGPAVLVMTARRTPEDLEEAFDAGADDYVSKPYSPHELRARVGSLARARALLRRAEAAESAYRDLYEAAPDALLTVDPSGRIAAANGQAVRLLAPAGGGLAGRQVQEILPDGAWETLRDPAPERPRTDVGLGERLFAPTVRSLPNGSMSISLRDVTRQRRSSQRRLDLYAVIAHDLRAPLSAVLMRTQVILRGGRGLLSAALLEDIQRIEHQIRSLVGMINDFLDLARLEEGAYQMRLAPVRPGELIRQVVDDFAALASVGEVALEATDTAPEATVQGDRERLVQAVTNLVGNALKFTPPGGRVAVASGIRGAELEVAVEDTGPGIAPEDQARIFDRYFKAHVAEEHKGTGLGLMIVREIARAHAGQVGVESEPGRGSRFWIRLPLAPR